MTPALDIARELLAQEPEHPLLPLPDASQVVQQLATPAGQTQLNALLLDRRRFITLARTQPFKYEPEPAAWADARAALADKIKVLALLGGNRSGKSRFCGKAVMEALLHHPGTTIVCVSEDETASIETQQKIIWHYLPPEIKEQCHNKRDRNGVFYVNHTEANGFSERKLVLPLPKGYTGQPSKILFATYGENPDDYEGLEFGHPTAWTVQWWADENLRLAWLNMFLRRGKFRPGSGLWSYTPIHGITPTIKEAVGKSAKTIKSVPSSLLPDRVNLPGLPKGHMPYIQQGSLPGVRVMYFHTEMSPFGPGPNGSGERYFESVRKDCLGKPSEYVKRIAYGYTENVIGLAYPMFSGDVHVIPPEALPAEGTNYCFIDPAGDRNWFILWVRVAPGNPRRLFIYREWPDAGYGEWATPSTRAVSSESRKGWDGDAGPAQRSQGWGTVRYKRLLIEEETIRHGHQADPYRKRLWEQAHAEPTPDPSQEGNLIVREEIRIRKVDPRAAQNPQASAKGGVNIITLFAGEDRNARGEVEAPRMLVLPAYSGKGIDDGVQHVNELLDYKVGEPLCPVLNEPKLYVCRTCVNTLWMFEHYTGMGGEDGGCKDPADLVRYIAQDDDLRHVTGGVVKTSGGMTRE